MGSLPCESATEYIGGSAVRVARRYRKTALVTSAFYGLGVTFAETLAGAGANVVLAARSLDKLHTLAAKLKAAGHEALALQCDVGNPEDVATTVAAGWKHFGRIDVLVNNAGSAADSPMTPERLPQELFEQTLRVNLSGTWHCCQQVGAPLRPAGFQAS
jgi:NAD(P)-dependent dehydrogenase (short-subunit alcohol dehydrogenase family)